MTDCDIAIIGAGPYGLMAAASLRSADSFRIAGFGETMSFWAEQMPVGMLLRSPYVACSIGDPEGRLGLPAYEEAIGERPLEPVPLSRFVDYGRWVQQQALPELSSERVREVARNGNGFNLALQNGEHVHAGRVIVAAGIADFKWYPEIFRALPQPLVSHACEHDDLGVFAGSNVLVIGGGQSALESAALLAEAGAQVEVVARAPEVFWLTRRWHHRLGPVSRLLYAPPDVGPAGVSWLVALPGAFKSLPRRLQTRMARRALRPAGAGWLPPRMGTVTITSGLSAVEASEQDGRAVVTFDDGSNREVDHVLLGTGYRVDVSRYPFLSRELVGQVKVANGYPVLGRGFESSVDGLHFLGAPAAWSFGPLMRFVAGTAYASRELVRGVLGRAHANGS
jgi:cation diffusion facilitator CzcD-associated flavoprotein CzcO